MLPREALGPSTTEIEGDIPSHTMKGRFRETMTNSFESMSHVKYEFGVLLMGAPHREPGGRVLTEASMWTSLAGIQWLKS